MPRAGTEGWRRRSQSIFNISSLAAVNPFKGGSACNASKFGLNGFTEAMMLDIRYDGIRVSTIMPGSVDTDFGAAPGGLRASRIELRPSQPPRK